MNQVIIHFIHIIIVNFYFFYYYFFTFITYFIHNLDYSVFLLKNRFPYFSSSSSLFHFILPFRVSANFTRIMITMNEPFQFLSYLFAVSYFNFFLLSMSSFFIPKRLLERAHCSISYQISFYQNN